MNIFVLYGGKSAEHDVSIISAYNILKEVYYQYYTATPIYITREGQWMRKATITSVDDVPTHAAMTEDLEPFSIEALKADDSIVFPVLHGPNGEDGTMQGLFEVMDVPYVGCGVLASSTGMDKIVSKVLFDAAGIPILPYESVTPAEWQAKKYEVITRVELNLLYPVYVKPANLGSSVGISEVKNTDELIEAIDLAFEYGHRVLVDQGIEAREVEIAVLGNDDVNVSVVGELVKDTQFYDYKAKYESNDVGLRIPAQLEDETVSRIKKYAADAFLATDGSGFMRADFFVTADNDIFINEVNTLPGFNPISMYPKLWEATGLSYGDLIEELIQLGLRRHKSRQMSSMKDR